jgi:hypothetical protein
MGKSIDRAYRWLRRGVVPSVLAVAAAGSADAAEQRIICGIQWEPEFVSKPLDRRFVFETVKVAPEGDLAYELSLAPCGKRRCPLEVRLRDGRALYDARKLDVCSVAEEPQSRPHGYMSGVGDPLQPDAGLSVSGTGYEYFGLDVFARSIALAPKLRGMLVHLEGGFEHTWRRHYLFVAQGKRLTLPWQADEVGGEDIAAVDLKDIDGDDFPEILLFMGIPVSEFLEIGAHLGSVGAAIYRWNGARMTVDPLRLSEAGVPMYAVIAGVFDSAVEADNTREKLWESHSCTYAYYLLRTDPFPQLKRGKFMLAKFAWRESVAEAEHRACNPAGKGFVAELIFFPEAKYRVRFD